MLNRTESARDASKTFPAHPSALYPLRQFLRERGTEDHLSTNALDDVVLAASEAAANSLRHTATPEIRVSWTASRDRVEVTVHDEGVFVGRAPLRGPDLEGGHGIPLMMALVDEVEIRKGTSRRPGTVIRLVKLRPD